MSSVPLNWELSLTNISGKKCRLYTHIISFSKILGNKTMYKLIYGMKQLFGSALILVKYTEIMKRNNI